MFATRQTLAAAQSSSMAVEAPTFSKRFKCYVYSDLSA